MKEKLLPVYGYNGRYLINRQGEVFSTYHNRVEPLSSWIADVGYRRVSLYCLKRKRGFPVSVHTLLYETFVSPLSEGYEVDHINRDSLDNRLENLRAVTRTQNCANFSKRKDSKYKGIHKNKGRTWMASIGNTVNGLSKPEYLGCFDSPVKAAVAYDLAAIRKFGVHANTNFIKIADTLENGRV